MQTRFSGSTNGFYPVSIEYGDALPLDLVDVSAEDFASLMAAQSAGSVIRSDAAGHPIAVDPLSLLTLSDRKSVKLAEIANAFAQRMSAVKAGYPADEIQSWFDQKSEAVAFTADKSTPTPLLSAMANARGITVADLATRILSNAQAYSAAAGALIGKRQKYEDAVNAAADAAAVASVAWND